MAFFSSSWADSLVIGESALARRPAAPAFMVRRMVRDEAALHGVAGWIDEHYVEGRVVEVTLTEPGDPSFTLHAPRAVWEAFERGAVSIEHPEVEVEVQGGRAPLAGVLGLSQRTPLDLVPVPVDLALGFELQGLPGGPLTLVDSIRDGRLDSRRLWTGEELDLCARLPARLLASYAAGQIDLGALIARTLFDGPISKLITLLGLAEVEAYLDSWTRKDVDACGVVSWLTLAAHPERVALRTARLLDPGGEDSLAEARP